MAANTSPMQAYNQALIDWRESSVEYEGALLDAAEAEAEWKAARAKVIVMIRHEDPKMSHALAEAVGDSDDDVIRLYRLRLVKNATVEGIKQRLLWHRAHSDNLRTNVVDERASNQFQSQFGAGPGRTTFEPGPDRSARQEPQYAEPPRRDTVPSQRPSDVW